MSWIRTTTPDQAAPPLAAIYARMREASVSGRVAELWQSLATDPAALERAWGLYRVLVSEPSPLTPAQAEMIAVVVSATNGCGYGVAHHGPKLAALVGEPLARAVATDYREANLAARDRVLLDAAVALTCEPAERTRADVERLREYGFDDAAIAKATAIAAWFNFSNRIACALGLEPEPGLEPWTFGAQR